MLVLFGACDRRPASYRRADATRLPAAHVRAAAAPSDLVGRWRVVSHDWGGLGAIGEKEARLRYAWRVSFDNDRAAFGPDACVAPRYADQMVDPDSFLDYQYRTRPARSAWGEGMEPGCA
jgi:hypothetical protein